MSGDPSLVCWERTVLIHSPWALVDPLLCVLCQTVPSVCFKFQQVSDESDMLIHFEGLKRTAPCAGHPWRISAGEGRSVEIGVSHNWSSAHQFSCRCSSPSSPWPLWNHWTGGNEVTMWCTRSQTLEQTFWILLHWMEGHCQTSQWQVCLQLWRVLWDGWWPWSDVQMYGNLLK